MPVIILRVLLGLAVPLYAAYLATEHGSRFNRRRPRLSAAIGGGLALTAGGWGVRNILRRSATAATVGGLSWASSRLRDRRSAAA